MTDLNEIKVRLAKLSRMTVENGCSEHEALNAASKIAAILDEHGLTLDSLKSYENADVKPEMTNGQFGDKKHSHEVRFCATAVADYFDCKVYKATVNGKKVINFFGFAQDVEACMVLINALAFAMESDYRKWHNTQNSDIHGKTLRKNFMIGFSDRVSVRLNEMKKERTNQNVTTGTALVVLKNQLVEKAFTVKIKKVITYYTPNEHAYAAGQAAGNNANLGVTNKQIGKI